MSSDRNLNNFHTFLDDLRSRTEVDPRYLSTFENVKQSELVPTQEEPKYSYENTGSLIEPSSVKILESTTNLLKILVTSDAKTANNLHKCIQYKVPTMRICYIIVDINTSISQDEAIAQRLGCVPLSMDASKFEYLESLETRDETNSIVYTLDVQSKNVPKIVTTSDLKCSNKNYLPAYKDIKLFTLTPGQSLKIAAYALKGIGDYHICFKPTANVGYRQEPNIKIRKNPENPEEFVKICPTGVFDIEDIGNTKTVVASKPRNCIMCRNCITDGNNKYVKLNRKRLQHEITINRKLISPTKILRDAIRIHNEMVEKK